MRWLRPARRGKRSCAYSRFTRSAQGTEQALRLRVGMAQARWDRTNDLPAWTTGRSTTELGPQMEKGRPRSRSHAVAPSLPPQGWVVERQQYKFRRRKVRAPAMGCDRRRGFRGASFARLQLGYIDARRNGPNFADDLPACPDTFMTVQASAEAVSACAIGPGRWQAVIADCGKLRIRSD